MATYLILNIIFMAVVFAAAQIKLLRLKTATIATLAVLVALTVVFDNAIVGLSIVDYNPQKILGVLVGVAPVEDFMYAILAAVLVPTIWHKLGKSHVR